MSDKMDIINSEALNEKELNGVAGGECDPTPHMQIGYATTRDYPGNLSQYAGTLAVGQPGQDFRNVH